MLTSSTQNKHENLSMINFPHNWQWPDICCFKESNRGTVLLVWFNFDPRMDASSHPLKCVGWNYSSLQKLQRFNGWLILSHILLDMRFIIHVGVNINPL